MSECAICQDALQDATQTSAMTCGHTFHSACLERYVAIADVSMHQLRCPSCRKSAADMESAEQNLLEAPAPPLGTVIEQINLESDAPVFEQVLFSTVCQPPYSATRLTQVICLFQRFVNRYIAQRA